MPAELTIEQLAAQTGMTVRNIRAHQARGMLDPPQVRLRVGYYGPEHVARLRLIRDLQDEGFNLAGIARLLDDRRGTAERMARVRRALAETAQGERAVSVSAEELSSRFGIDPSDAAAFLRRAERVGVVRETDEGTLEVPSPSLLAVAEQVIAAGISLSAALAAFEEIEPHVEAAARALVRPFIDELWKPFEAAGTPLDRWAEIERSLERLIPLATEALVAAFGQQMTRQLQRTQPAPHG